VVNRQSVFCGGGILAVIWDVNDFDWAMINHGSDDYLAPKLQLRSLLYNTAVYG
jgi:hypothetical protein